MKKSIKLTIVLALTVLLCTLLAIFVSAETYSVQYKNMNWDGNRDKVNTDENGQITLRDTGYTTDATSYEITGADGNKTTVQRQFYGWYDEEGNFYEKGATVTLTKNVVLREAFGIEVYTLSDLKKYLGNFFWYTRLGADIVADSTIGTQNTGNGNMVTLDLNGHTLTSTAEYAFAGQRCGFIITGEGTINHTYTDTKGGLWNSTVHGYGEGQQRLWIGKDVTINTTGALLHSTSDWPATTNPLLRIYGTTTSAYLANTLKVPTKNFEIHEGANVTVTGNVLINNRSKATGLQTTLYIYGGTLNFPADVNYYSDFSRIRYEITGGSFVNELPKELLKHGYACVYNDETNLYDVVYVSCTLEGSEGVHNFVPKESYAGMVSTCEGEGVYYFRCACGDYYVDALDAVGHSYDVLVSETPATCTTKAYKIYKCIRCDATNKVESGNALGHSYTSISIEKVATTTETGIKRVTCERCADSYTYEYSFDPRDQVVTIVVKTDNGTKEITATVGELYDIVVTETTDGFTSKFNGVKTITDPDNSEVTYNISKIVKLVIPAGVTEISAGSIKNATELTEIVLLDGANLTFATKSIDNCTKLSKIVLGNCTVVFAETTINGNTADFEIDATNANVTFNKAAFQGKSVTKLTLGKDKYYTFDENCFKQAKLESLVFPDGSNPIPNGGKSLVTFVGASDKGAAFYGCPNLKYVYFGANLIAPNANGEIWLSSKPFDCANYLNLVVLMDITHVDKYVFCCAAAGNTSKDFREMNPNGLTIYHHASTFVFQTNETFVNRDYYGVTFYTSANVQSLGKCKYTVYNGIPHAYTEGNIEATCTAMGSTGYTTDCPCGVVSNSTYTVYSTLDTTINSTNGSIEIGQATPALGHEFDAANGATVVATTPATCLNDATTTYKCARCDETLTLVQEDTATGHNVEGVEWEVKSEATCAADGLKQKICKNCKALAESEVIPATGHNIEGVEWTKTSDPTCTLAGTEVKKCITCSTIVETQAIDMLGHNPGEFVTVLNPDCDDNGLKEQYCTRCEVLIATEAIEKLGHEFDVADGATLVGMEYANGFNKAGAILTKCARCAETNATAVAPIFEAKGYSTNPDKNAINGGYSVNTELLALYESYNGAITYGVVIANANSFTGSFFNNGAVNTEKAIQVPITMKSYSNFDLTLSGFGVNADTLELVICAYVIDENGNASFIQAENDYAIATTIGGQSFTKVTLDLVVANVTEQPDALVPSSDEE